NYLAGKFDWVVLSDLSLEMIRKSKNIFPKVVCDMRELPFKNNFDFVYSTFDSVNYLTTENDVAEFFLQVKQILPLNGYFAFDVSLEMNSFIYEEDLNREEEFEGIKFRQISKYHEKKRIHINEFLMEFPDGRLFREVHRQKIYPFQKYFEILENCGMIVTDCYEALSFIDANENSERAQFIVRRG
ncbi:MAG: class I SAM-dependent methyltransferase, partial [Chlorobi bacterium]|nr:class I SAM-dependent methyltransferase [Chlorobiota bacterium]